MNPLFEQRQENLAFLEIAADIMRTSRTELSLNLRFLSLALSSLQLLPAYEILPAGTDGTAFYYHPDQVIARFRKGRVGINRLYLHSLIHCLFGHLWSRRDRDPEYWNLACDITAEWILDDLQLRCLHLPKTPVRRECYRRIAGWGKEERERNVFVPTAQKVYRILCKMHPGIAMLDQMKREFTIDDHRYWMQEEQPPQIQLERQQKWEDIRDRMQTELETFSKDAAQDAKSLTDQVELAGRKRYDYREFLKKFAVLKEEMQMDVDSFDYIYYNYGMTMYGNMPLIEPLETREVKKIEDFVIVIDTSMSCKGELVRQFLEETCGILQESESFFRKINLHILQCDDQIREDVTITSREEFHSYMSSFTVKGLGGTDFRPAFIYVEELLQKGAFSRLRGLIYFTDGYGTFPLKKPVYDTAFVFLKEDYRDVDVPPWAIKLILDASDLEETKDSREAGRV